MSDPAELKTEGQAASVATVSRQTFDDFAAILTMFPPGAQITVNHIRDFLDLADIPASARGGLFAGAVKAGLVEPVLIGGYPARVPSSGRSAHCATVVVYRRCAA